MSKLEKRFIFNRLTKVKQCEQSGSGVAYAVSALLRDIGRVLTDKIEENSVITVLDASIDKEEYIIDIEPQKITIRAGDELGFIYGLYHISQKHLGVEPFWFWKNIQTVRHKRKNVPTGRYASEKPIVRYRGWFINDEVLIDGWRYKTKEFRWEMIFEAMMRLGGNMTIPGTDKNCDFGECMAQKMGLYVTHNHARPLGAEMFARVYPGHKPSYTENPRLFEKLWEDAAIKQKDKKTIFTLAFRGQGDRAFWEDSGEQTGERSCGELMSEIYRKQIEIIRKHIPDAVFCTNLYGEAVKLYKDGFLKIPDGVIKVWGDNGYGKMVSRRQMNDNPRIVSLPDDNSKSGVYYHCSFHDLQASNHLSMSPNSPEFMASELNHAYNLGASEYWIINCGSVLPHLYTLEYIAALWNNSALPKAQPWQTQWSEHTAEYGPNSDDRAGEQFWHHPVRELACALIKGKTAEALESLRWFSDKGFPDQITDYQRIAKKYAPAWKDFYTSNKAPQVSLYYFSAAGALAISNSFIKFLKGDIINAFIECGKAVEYYKNAVKALENESIGQWEGFFDNDCLTDVRLTVYVAESWMRYLRVLGDSPAFLEWEKKLLYSKGESVIYMLSATECPKSDNELWNAIK